MSAALAGEGLAAGLRCPRERDPATGPLDQFPTNLSRLVALRDDAVNLGKVRCPDSAQTCGTAMMGALPPDCSLA